MITITGINGQLGRATTDGLLKKIPAAQLTGFVRDLNKVQDLQEKGLRLFEGDYDHYASLLKAFKGTEKLLFISTMAIREEDRISQHTNVVKAAVESGVQHIFYTSIVKPLESDPGPLGRTHLYTENLLKTSGLSYTIFRNNLYMEVIPGLTYGALETGSIPFPAGTGKIRFAYREDIAAAIAGVMINSAGHENKVYEISGTAAYSFNDIADEMTAVTGKTIQYVSISDQEQEAALEKLQLPAELIQMHLHTGIGIRAGIFDQASDTLEKLLGSKTTPLREYLNKIYAL